MMNPMRILYLSNNFPLVSETFVINEISDLIEAGADIRILSMYKPSETQYSFLPEKLGFADKIIDFSFTPMPRRRQIWQMLKWSFANVSKGNGAFLNLWLSPVWPGLPSRYQLMGLADKIYNDPWQPDILHCHFGNVGRIGAFLKHHGQLNAKLSVIFHGFDVSKMLKEYSSKIYDSLFAKGDRFFSISRFYLDVLKRLGIPERKTSVFHMGVDVEKFEYRERNISVATVECLVTGRMVEKKGHEFTIRAFAQIKKDRPDINIRIHLAGDGPLLEDLKKLAVDLQLQDQIIFYGSLQHDKIQSLLDQAHIFILPSVTSEDGDMEGIPVALMEAMAMGIPVVSTFHSGIPELIEDGVSGFLVAEKDVLSLGERIVYVIDNFASMPAITRKAREVIETEFNRKKQSEILKHEFLKMINPDFGDK